MHLMDEGKSITYIEKNLKMGRNTIKLARKRYLSGGEVALLEPEYSPHHDVSDKIKIVLDIEKKRATFVRGRLTIRDSTLYAS